MFSNEHRDHVSSSWTLLCIRLFFSSFVLRTHCTPCWEIPRFQLIAFCKSCCCETVKLFYRHNLCVVFERPRELLLKKWQESSSWDIYTVPYCTLFHNRVSHPPHLFLISSFSVCRTHTAACHDIHTNSAVSGSLESFFERLKFSCAFLLA